MSDDFSSNHATPIESMRAFCVQCMGYQPSLTKGCTAPKCPLYPYRNGSRPKNSKLIGLSQAIDLSKRRLPPHIDAKKAENLSSKDKVRPEAEKAE